MRPSAKHRAGPGGATLLANAELIFRLAEAHAELGSNQEAGLLLGTLLEAARASGDRLLRLRCAVRHIRPTLFLQGRENVDRAEIEDAARELPDTDERAQAHFMLGLLAKYAGDLEETQRHLERAAAIRKAAGLEPSGDVAGQLAAVALRGGRCAAAEALYAEAAGIEERMGRRTTAAANRFNMALARFQGGCVEGIEEAMEEERQLLALEGARHMASQARVCQAEVRWARGDLPGALAMCQEELERHRRAGYLPGIALAGRLLAELLLARGEIAGVDAALTESRSAAERLGDVPSLACLLAVQALRHHVVGEREAGDRAAAEGLALCSGFNEARTRMWFALVLAEGVVYGGSAEMLVTAAELLHALPETPLLEASRTVIAAARAFADVGFGCPATLRAGTEALQSRTIGDRRAVQWIVGQLFAADASRRDGRVAELERSTTALLGTTRSLDHVWLEAATLSLGAQLDESGHGTALRALLERLAGATGTARDRLLNAWGRPP